MICCHREVYAILPMLLPLQTFAVSSGGSRIVTGGGGGTNMKYKPPQSADIFLWTEAGEGARGSPPGSTPFEINRSVVEAEPYNLLSHGFSFTIMEVR